MTPIFTGLQYFTDAVSKAILPLFKNQGNPFAMVYWSRDPDGTQHNQGDSLNSLTPGINGSTSKAAVKNADNNNMAAIGPDFKQGFNDPDPVSNADVAVTLAKAVGIQIPAKGNLIGRTLNESLLTGPASVPYTSNLTKTSDSAANGQQTVLKYQTVGNTVYFDASGYQGRTVGL